MICLSLLRGFFRVQLNLIATLFLLPIRTESAVILAAGPQVHQVFARELPVSSIEDDIILPPDESWFAWHRERIVPHFLIHTSQM